MHVQFVTHAHCSVGMRASALHTHIHTHTGRHVGVHAPKTKEMHSQKQNESPVEACSEILNSSEDDVVAKLGSVTARSS